MLLPATRLAPHHLKRSQTPTHGPHESPFRMSGFIGAEEDLRSLTMDTPAREYRKNQSLFLAGDPARNLYRVLSGQVMLFSTDAAGHQSVIRVASGGEFLGLFALLKNLPVYLLSAQVIEPATVMEIDVAAVRRHMAAKPAFSAWIMDRIADEVRKNIEHRQVLSLSATKRVAWLLLRMSRHLVGKGGNFSFPYDKKVVAAELCIAPETLSRSLSQLKCASVSSAHNQVNIENFEALYRFLAA